jgi:hypothetical protein
MPSGGGGRTLEGGGHLLTQPRPRCHLLDLAAGSDLEKEAATNEEDHREEKGAISPRHATSSAIDPATMFCLQGKIIETKE